MSDEHVHEGTTPFRVARELERLQAENAALREIVEAVAGYAWQTVPVTAAYDVSVPCPWCRHDITRHYHASICPVPKARAILGIADAE